jgi:hypothetical protein
MGGGGDVGPGDHRRLLWLMPTGPNGTQFRRKDCLRMASGWRESSFVVPGLAVQAAEPAWRGGCSRPPRRTAVSKEWILVCGTRGLTFAAIS